MARHPSFEEAANFCGLFECTFAHLRGRKRLPVRRWTPERLAQMMTSLTEEEWAVIDEEEAKEARYYANATVVFGGPNAGKSRELWCH